MPYRGYRRGSVCVSPPLGAAPILLPLTRNQKVGAPSEPSTPISRARRTIAASVIPRLHCHLIRTGSNRPLIGKLPGDVTCPSGAKVCLSRPHLVDKTQGRFPRPRSIPNPVHLSKVTNLSRTALCIHTSQPCCTIRHPARGCRHGCPARHWCCRSS